MGKREYLLGTVLSVVCGVLFSLHQQQTGSSYQALIKGRNNTILFITNPENGLSNVHLATSFALLENHPSTEIHFASFHKQAKRVQAISDAALKKNVNRTPIRFHEIPGRSMEEIYAERYGGWETMIKGPGYKGLGDITANMQRYLSTWEINEHYDIILAVQNIITEVDPAVVVLDFLCTPAMDAIRDLNRFHAILSPNPLSDSFPNQLPYGQVLWRYPAFGSGFPFSVPWRLIPENIYMVLRMGIPLIHMPEIAAKREFLASKGIQDGINHLLRAYRSDVPWIAGQMDEAALPFHPVPANVSAVGPIVISTAPAAEQDAALAEWLAQRPTLLVNMGSVFTYREPYARAMAEALEMVLARTNVQVLWKYQKLGNYSDDFRAGVEEHIASGRLRIEDWLGIDPPALLESGHVVASVHHGGAGCYNEAIA